MFSYYRNRAAKNSIRSNVALTDEQMAKVAPSIFAQQAHESRSDRYAYIPTIEILNGLRKEGFFPFSAMQTTTRKEGHREFTKHLVRMRHYNSQEKQGDVNEILLINSHNGASSYQMMAGCFRFVCSNGMICGDIASEIRVRHQGNIQDNVIEGATRILEDFELVDQHKEEMRAITLSRSEQEIFANNFLQLRYDDPTKPMPVNADLILQPRRHEDNKNTLWSTFNVIQENTIKGGVWGRNAKGRLQKTRAVKGIDQDIKLNKALWAMAEQMKALKA